MLLTCAEKERVERTPFVPESELAHSCVKGSMQRIEGWRAGSDWRPQAHSLAPLLQRLAVRSMSYPRTGRLLDRNELQELYRHRGKVMLSGDEAKLILASTRREEHRGLKLRRNELGWYWFRNLSRYGLTSLLMELAGDKNASVRWPAVNMLGYCACEDAFKLFQILVADRNVEIAVEAVKGLARLSPRRSVPALRLVCCNQGLDPQVRRQAAKALATLDERGRSALIARLAGDAVPSMRQVAVALMGEPHGPGDAEALERLVKDKSSTVRGMAMVALAKLGRAADHDRFAERARNGTKGDQPAAIRALGQFADPSDLPLLTELASERPLSVRWAVAEVLSRYPCQEAVGLLKVMANGATCGVALDSLVRLPAELTVRGIRELLDDPNDNVRANLAPRLADWKHPNAGNLLRKLAADRDWAVRTGAASSLGEVGSAKDLPLLRKMCRDQDERVRTQAAWAVGGFRQEADTPLLKALIYDGCADVRTVAARRLIGTAARKDLVPWVDENVTRLSFEALKEFDYHLYAPAWLRNAAALTDDDSSLALGIYRCRH